MYHKFTSYSERISHSYDDYCGHLLLCATVSKTNLMWLFLKCVYIFTTTDRLFGSINWHKRALKMKCTYDATQHGLLCNKRKSCHIHNARYRQERGKKAFQVVFLFAFYSLRGRKNVATIKDVKRKGSSKKEKEAKFKEVFELLGMRSFLLMPFNHRLRISRARTHTHTQSEGLQMLCFQVE